MYSNLVNGPDDFIGLVAYSIYKQEKIDYIRSFEEKHGKSPKPEELIEFHQIAQSRLESYKELATGHVNDFCQSVCQEYGLELNRTYEEKLLKAKCFGWGAAITQSVIGSIFGAIAVGVLVVLLLYSRYGLEWVVRNAVGTLATTPNIEEVQNVK